MNTRLLTIVSIFTFFFIQPSFSQGPQGMPDFSGEWDLVRPSSGAVVGQYTITLIPDGIYISPKKDGTFMSPTQKGWIGKFTWNGQSIMFENTTLGFRIMTGSGNYDSMGLDVNGGMNFEYQYLKRANSTPAPAKGGSTQGSLVTGGTAAAPVTKTLNDAVKSGDLDAAEALIKSTPESLKTLSPQGTTPLHEAVIRGDAMMIETLMNAGADPNTPATNGKSSIDVAIEKGNTEVTETIINRTMDVKISDASLQKVVNTKDTEMLNLLLGHGVDANKAIRMIEKTNNVELFYEVSSNYSVNVDNAMFESAVLGKRTMMAQAIMERGINNDQALQYCIEKNEKNLIPMALAFGASPGPALQYAVSSGDMQLAQSAIGDYSADPNPPMKTAVEGKNAQMVGLLVQSGANPTSQMALASAQGSDDVVRVLLGAGGDANAGVSAAADSDKWSTVKVLVGEGGGNPNLAIKQSVDKGNTGVAQYLLSSGASGTDPSLLVSACEQQNAQMVALLIQNGADPNAGMTKAIEKGNMGIATQLLDAGASASNPSYLENTVNNKNKGLTNLLVQRGADPNNGMKAACTKGYDGILTSLIQQGADGSRAGLLNAAVSHNNTALVKHLLDAGANPNEGIDRAVKSNADKVVAQLGKKGVPLTNIDYMTTAVNQGASKVAKVLIEGGCDPKPYVSPNGGNYLHIAAEKEDFPMAQILLTAGVNPNKADTKGGNTPLHIAVEGKNDNLDLVMLLVDRGNADVNAVNNNGKTVLQEAKGGKVKSYLKDNGASKKVK